MLTEPSPIGEGFLYVGHISTLTGCKSLYAPSWEEALANGKGVAGDCKSEGGSIVKSGVMTDRNLI